MHETTLAALDFPAIGAAFTTVYTDYPLRFVMDADAARQHVTLNTIDRAHSLVWLDDDGAVVALAALGVRGGEGWVGGFGVVPGWRGQGMSHRLIARVLEIGGGLGLHTLWLEVLTNNPRAIQTYRRAGFAPVRDLRVFVSPVPATPPDTTTAAVREADPVALIGERTRITAVRPVWQRAPQSLAQMSGLAGLALGGAKPEAYAIYRVLPNALFLVDVAVPDASAVTPLIGALAARYPDRAIHLSNEPEESPVCAALDRLGWTERLRQHEMVYHVTAGAGEKT
jgi:GNAT superfamily N-acetyltransferase